jgi:hypothetical protein
MQDQLASLPHILNFYDAILTPVYILLLLFWVMRWKKKNYSNSPLKKYIIPAFLVKVVCCILLAFLYEFYYGFGDPHNYYTGAVEIWNAAKANPIYGLELVFKPIDKCSQAAQEFATHISMPAFSPGIVSMFKISGFIGLFCFGTYLPIALVFTLLSFIGSWKIFTAFAEEFPHHLKKIAITCLFIPSFIFWSTNILKDPLCIFGLGLCVSALHNFLKGRFSLFILFEMFAGAFIILALKDYIFYIFFAAGLFAVYIRWILNSKSKYKFFIKCGFWVTLILLTTVIISQRDYLVEIFYVNSMNTIMVVQNVQKDEGGSVYVLSNIDYSSFTGIIRTYLQSLNVALFRPYFWEASSVIVLANALESFIVMLVTLYLLLKLKITGFFTFAFQNSILTFALIFTLLLAPLAGLISFNFGTLVRYKTPVVPFYYTYLILLYYKSKKEKSITEKSKEKKE